MKRKRVAEATKGVGKPKVGGSFDLINQNGEPVSEKDVKGRYSLVSLQDATRMHGSLTRSSLSPGLLALAVGLLTGQS
jgi:hypothetical protein